MQAEEIKLSDCKELMVISQCRDLMVIEKPTLHKMPIDQIVFDFRYGSCCIYCKKFYLFQEWTKCPCRHDASWGYLYCVPSAKEEPKYAESRRSLTIFAVFMIIVVILILVDLIYAS